MNAIYARQSVDKKDSLSIEGQIALCRKHAGEEALVFQDRGFSGKNTRRPAFAELMQAAKEGRIGAQIGAFLNAYPLEPAGMGAPETTRAVLELDRKIDRLVAALSESGEIPAAYISKEIERLHREREALLTPTAEQRQPPARMDFNTADFEEKKLIAAEFIDRILLNEDRVNIVWKIRPLQTTVTACRGHG